jgi:hypothetical protein
VLPLAIGAVVLGLPCTFQTPLSGHFSPVLAVVPIGIFTLIKLFPKDESGNFLSKSTYRK